MNLDWKTMKLNWSTLILSNWNCKLNKKLKEAEAMKAKARAKAEAEAARIREAAAKVLKEQEEKEYQENLVVVKETMDRMLNITTLDVLRERCTNNGDDMNIKDVVYCYDMTGVRLDSVLAPCGLLYKADVLKIGMRKFGGKKSQKKREKAYTIHFHGFSKKWDTQVPQSRLLNVNAASDEVCEASEIIYDIERKKWDAEEAKLVEEEERLAAEAKAREPPKAEALHQVGSAAISNYNVANRVRCMFKWRDNYCLELRRVEARALIQLSETTFSSWISK